MEKGLGRQMNLLKFANVCVTILLASLATTHYASANEPVSPEARRLTPAAFVQLLVERNLEIQYARESSEVSRYLSLSEDALYEPKGLIGLRNEGISRQRTDEERKGLFGNVDPDSPTVLNQRDRSAEVGVSQKLPSGAELAVSYRIARKNDNVTEIGNTSSKEFNTVLSISLKQPLLRNAGRAITETDRRVAEIESQIQAIQFEQQIAKSAVDGLSQYWDTFRERTILDLLREAVAKTEESVADARARAAAGRSPAAIERDLQGVLLNRRAELMRGESSWKEAQSKLATALNLGWNAGASDEMVETATHLSIERPLADDADALIQWPLYRIAILKRQQAQIRLDYAANQMKPAMDLVVGYSGTGYGKSAIDARNTAADIRFPTWYVGINLELPLNGNERSTQQFLAQGSRLTQADLEVEAVKRAFENDLGAKREMLRLSSLNFRLAQDEVVLRESIFKNEQSRLRLGSGQLSEVIRRYFEVVDSRKRAIESRSRYEVAMANFHFATGTILSVHSVDIQGTSASSSTAAYVSTQAPLNSNAQMSDMLDRSTPPERVSQKPKLPAVSISAPPEKQEDTKLAEGKAVADQATEQGVAQVPAKKENSHAHSILDDNAGSAALSASANPPRFDYPDDGRRRVIQVGTFVENSRARAMRLRLLRSGIETLVNIANVKGERSIRIRVGPFTKAADLQKYIDKIKALSLEARVLTY
jgi:outer membrane protein TolC/cell division septation protein DedD